jgi:hypothetical protein
MLQMISQSIAAHRHERRHRHGRAYSNAKQGFRPWSSRRNSCSKREEQEEAKRKRWRRCKRSHSQESRCVSDSSIPELSQFLTSLISSQLISPINHAQNPSTTHRAAKPRYPRSVLLLPDSESPRDESKSLLRRHSYWLATRIKISQRITMRWRC